MDHIQRESLHFLNALFTKTQLNQGVIVSGIVGCGKTTLIETFLQSLSDEIEIFRFTGDDLAFRVAVSQDTKHIFNIISERTTKKAMLFIDEIQKTEEAFDAIKYAFDHANCSFIVSGSNPDYLNTVAKTRLQRRAHFFQLRPFSLPEILAHQNYFDLKLVGEFRERLVAQAPLKDFKDLIPQNFSFSEKIQGVLDQYVSYGGIPRAFLSNDNKQALFEVQNIAERGFESLSTQGSHVEDLIRVELAKMNSQEFSYQGIFQKTRLNKRATINQVIDQLMNHGYLLKKSPILFHPKKTTYLSIFSFIDPGLVSYFSGEIDDPSGHRVESLVHARLDSLQNEIPTKFEISYFKPYHLDINEKVKYLPGEIDFILTMGKKIIPIEVKKSRTSQNSDFSILKTLIKTHRLPYGVVLYGGMPKIVQDEGLLFWPYWMI